MKPADYLIATSAGPYIEKVFDDGNSNLIRVIK